MTSPEFAVPLEPAEIAAPLNRAALAVREGAIRPTPPVRIVHIGLGAFHRAHQAWYTAAANDAANWGIAAFTGRNPQAALELAAQDGLFTLIERSDDADRVAVIPSIVEAHDGGDLARFVDLLAAPSTAIVTITVTEPGYRLTADGLPNLTDPAMVADLAWLTDWAGGARNDAASDIPGGPTTTLGRLLFGLESRRRAGSGPIAVVPCDNMPDNGPFVATGIGALARAIGEDTAEWIGQNVSFVSTSVDRITPKTTPEDLATAARLSGWADAAPVVTEPFRDWVLSGDFPAGRPAWETAGARFVDDIEPFERRKLWLLNGAHSLLAYAGALRGHSTVAAAIGDPVCRRWVIEFWDDAVRHLPAAGLALDDYRAALLERFDNARIEHRLGQIGMEGVAKLRVRIAPIVLAEREQGRDAAASVLVLGSWVAFVRSGREIADAQSAAIAEALAGHEEKVVEALVRLIDPALADDGDVLAAIQASAAAAGN